MHGLMKAITNPENSRIMHGDLFVAFGLLAACHKGEMSPLPEVIASLMRHGGVGRTGSVTVALVESWPRLSEVLHWLDSYTTQLEEKCFENSLQLHSGTSLPYPDELSVPLQQLSTHPVAPTREFDPPTQRPLGMGTLFQNNTWRIDLTRTDMDHALSGGYDLHPIDSSAREQMDLHKEAVTKAAFEVAHGAGDKIRWWYVCLLRWSKFSLVAWLSGGPYWL